MNRNMPPFPFNDPSGKKFEDFQFSSVAFVGYEIDRSDIVARSTKSFLEFWDIEGIAKAGRLHEMYGKVAFRVGGYDNDERAPFEIPEVRAHLKKLAEEWPYFFYADNLQTEFLIRLIQCMVPNMTVRTTASDPTNYKAAMKTAELNEAYKKLFDGLCQICPKDSRMTHAEFDSRVAAIQGHLRKEFLGYAQ